MDPSVVSGAQRGLEASWATPLRFWNARAHRTEGAERALDELHLHPEARPAVDLARRAVEQAPERKLELYRVALETLAQPTVTATAGIMAGLALKLLGETRLEGEDRSRAAEALYEGTPASRTVRTLLAEIPAPERLQLVQECATPEEMALRLPDPKPLELAEQHEAFRRLPQDAPRPELARRFLQSPRQWMAGWLRDHRQDPRAEKLARWTIAEAPPGDWKQHDDPIPVAMHIHEPYRIEGLLGAALDSDHPERWLPAVRREARHRPQEGAVQLLDHLPPDKLREGLELIARGANAAALESHFPCLRGVGPREGYLKLLHDQPEAVQARCLKALGEQPGNLPAIAVRTAGATSNVAEKLYLAQLGLIELDRTAGNKPATRLLWSLTELHRQTPHPQALWLRTAMALEGLAVASRAPLPETGRGLVDLGLRMLDSSFMVPSWYAPAALSVVDALESLAPSPLLEASRARLVGRVQPEQARQVLVELRDLLDSTPYRLSQGERGAAISEEGEAVIVGGVKVSRRGRRGGRVEERAPAPEEWPELRAERPRGSLATVIEVRHAERGSIQGVYNPNRGAIEWRESERQLAGAYNPRKGEVEWREASAGIAALYSPNQGQVVFKTGQGAIQGLFNPANRRERFEAVYTGRRAGAVRPLDGREHWESCASGYNSGVYDPLEEDFRFVTSYSSAVAAVSTDPSAATLASNGTAPG